MHEKSIDYGYQHSLCVWLAVPGMGTCVPDNEKWDKPRVDTKINAEIEAKATLVLPLATLIETGNHIAQANHRLILWAIFMEV